MQKRLFLLVFGIVFIVSSHAQSVRKNTTNVNAWFMYFGNHKISKRFGIHAEVQVRRHDVVSDWQQLLLRTGIDFYTAQVRFTAGYAFIETYPYGDYPVKNVFPEHRIWQQALINNPIGKIKLSHRYRLEQRFIGNSATGEFKNGRYENRIRYMARLNIPLQGALEPKKLYLSIYDEVFVNFGKEVAYNLFDQNRAYAALGYHLGKIGKVEIGYLYQIIQQRNLLSNPTQSVIENNHTLQVALISDLPFYKESK